MARAGGYDRKEAPKFSRQWWLRAARNFLWVVLVTLVIWVYADLEKTNTATLRATLRLTNGDSSRLVLLGPVDAGRHDVTIAIELRGSQGNLSDYEQEIKKSGGVIEYDLTTHHGAGVHTIAVADLLAQTEAVKKAGLTVEKASPPTVSVELDEAHDEPEAEIVFQSSGATYSQAEVNPPKTGFRVSKRLWMSRQGSEAPKLRTYPVDLSKVATDQPIAARIEPTVAIGPGERIPVLPDVREVRVTVKVSDRTEEKTLKVPVRLLTPYTWAQPEGTWDRFDLNIEDRDRPNWLVEVTVSGPKRAVEKIQQQHILAYVVLTDDHKSPSGTGHTPTILVRLAETPVDIREIRDVKLRVSPSTLPVRLTPEPATPPAP